MASDYSLVEDRQPKAPGSHPGAFLFLRHVTSNLLDSTFSISHHIGEHRPATAQRSPDYRQIIAQHLSPVATGCTRGRRNLRAFPRSSARGILAGCMRSLLPLILFASLLTVGCADARSRPG